MQPFKGNYGGVILPGVAGATLKAVLAGVTDEDYTAYLGKGVAYSLASDWSVEYSGANTVPDGVINSINKNSAGDFEIGVYSHKYSGYMEISLAGLALGDYVESAASGAWQKDNVNGTALVVAYTTPLAHVLVTKGKNVTALAGTLTGSVDGTIADVAAIAIATSGGNTYSDAAVNTAVNTAITSVNLQLKELQTVLNQLVAAQK